MSLISGGRSVKPRLGAGSERLVRPFFDAVFVVIVDSALRFAIFS